MFTFSSVSLLLNNEILKNNTIKYSCYQIILNDILLKI